jgi:hypothetical protein
MGDVSCLEDKKMKLPGLYFGGWAGVYFVVFLPLGAGFGMRFELSRLGQNMGARGYS